MALIPSISLDGRGPQDNDQQERDQKEHFVFHLTPGNTILLYRQGRG